MAPEDFTTEASGFRAQTAVGVFRDSDQAGAAVMQLRQAGFADAISVIGRDHDRPLEQGVRETAAVPAAGTGAAAGAILGGVVLGALSLAIPGIGLVVVGGPIAAGLIGAAAGASAGGLVGSFAGLGMSTEHAKHYEEAVRSGSVVVTVHTAGGTAGELASDILKAANASDVTLYRTLE